eukprot:evm.model.scf_1804.2 EVM.evm.TU.scf_1804.2   scf_1804:13354-13833(+)
MSVSFLGDDAHMPSGLVANLLYVSSYLQIASMPSSRCGIELPHPLAQDGPHSRTFVYILLQAMFAHAQGPCQRESCGEAVGQVTLDRRKSVPTHSRISQNLLRLRSSVVPHLSGSNQSDSRSTDGAVLILPGFLSGSEAYSDMKMAMRDMGFAAGDGSA